MVQSISDRITNNTIFILFCLSSRLQAIAYLGGPAFAVSIVDGINKGGVVPVLNNIVRSVVDLHLNGVPTIVYQEDYAVLPASDHS
jgi:hypothetical protein